MSKEFKNINDLFKDSFADFKVEPSKTAWSKIMRKLWLNNFLKFSIYSFNVYYAASIVTTLIVSGLFLTNKYVNETINEPVVINNEMVTENHSIEPMNKMQHIYPEKNSSQQKQNKSLGTRQQIETINEVAEESETQKAESQEKPQKENISEVTIENEISTNQINTDNKPIENHLTESFEIIPIENVSKIENEKVSENDVIIYDTIRIHVYDTIFLTDTLRSYIKENQSIKNNKFSIEAYFAPTISSSIYESNNSEFDNSLKLLKSSVSSSSGFFAGLNFNYQRNNLLFSSGIAYSRYNENFNDTMLETQIEHTTYNNYIPNGGYYTYDTIDWHFNYDTINGYYVYVPIIQQTWTNTFDTVLVTLSDTTSVEKYYSFLNSYSYLEIPFSFGYQLNYKRFSFIPNAGVTVGFFLNAKGKTLVLNNSMISLSDKDVPFLNTVYSWRLGLGIQYHFNDHFSFVAEPFFRQNMNSIYSKKQPYSQKFSSAGVKFGIKFNF